MILKIAWKTLLTHPIRTTVLGMGFGLGVSVMVTLLGVGEVVLDQARAPALVGGGDVLMTGMSGPVTAARFALQQALNDPAVRAASPRRRAEMFLITPGKPALAVTAHGTIPSLEHATRNPEVSGIDAWTDAAGDEAWAKPNASDVLRAMDRFHAVPDVPARAASWAEWLYFKGRSGDVQFYMTFLAGPRTESGERVAGVRLQVDRGGSVVSYATSAHVSDAALLSNAPDMTIGSAKVELRGLQYHITFDLPRIDAQRQERAAGTIDITAAPGRSLPPIELRGNGGWISGYTVPVMSGTLAGTINVSGTTLELSGSGYHDHNWGFWQGVSWRWGQVQHEGLSFVYGRVIPPPDAADPARLPGFVVALGPDGPLGYATRVSIEEFDDPDTHRPTRIVVTGRGPNIDLRFTIDVEDAIVNRGGALSVGPDFLQLRSRFTVSGFVSGRRIEFTAPGAAETFRE